eukprot:4220831-Pleurochrysis_carterae.AAC.1
MLLSTHCRAQSVCSTYSPNSFRHSPRAFPARASRANFPRELPARISRAKSAPESGSSSSVSSAGSAAQTARAESRGIE